MADVDALAENFANFCKVSGNKNNKMTNKAFSKMCKDAKVEDKKWTSTDTDITWAKAFPKLKEIDFATFKKGLHDVIGPEYAKKQNLSAEEGTKKLVEKLIGGNVQMKNTTGTSKTGNVSGMTDASKYTGSHKERFDDSGKGKGIEGREDRAANDGYVGGYKNKDSYDKTH